MNRIRSERAIAAAMVIAVVVAGCGDDTNDSSGSPSSPAASAPSSEVDCTGEPLRFTTITSGSGPLAYPSIYEGVQVGYEAALTAVNDECALGRPLDVVVCDDRSDPNAAEECGRQAQQNGSLALLGLTGPFETGPTAAGLPGILTVGGNTFDLTDPRSFPSAPGLSLILGQVSAAAAADAERLVMVAVDIAAIRAFVGICEDVAESLGVTMDTIFVPVDATDFAPVAAQVAERQPDAISVLLPSSAVPFFNALDVEGLSAANMPIMTPSYLFPPEVVEQLGEKANGVYVLSHQLPPSAADNSGIEQMREELDAVGVSDVDHLSPAVTAAWSNVHILVDALEDLPPADLASLDSARLVEAMQRVEMSRPEYAPFDLTANAYPDDPILSTLRLFSRQAMVLRIEDGVLVPVSPFGDVTQPFDLDS